MPLYFEVTDKLTASEAGFALIPIVLMTTPGSMLSGRSMMYLRRYKVTAIAGAVIAILSVSALVVWPAMPLYGVIAALTFIGLGAGAIYPICTVSIQNAVARHQVGTATGAMNFFRALASTLAVAIMGTILLSGLGAMPQRGGSVEVLVAVASQAGIDMAGLFRWVFVAADIFLGLALVALLLLEERPLYGPAVVTPPAAPEPRPAPAE
jgi:MFS family permease